MTTNTTGIQTASNIFTLASMEEKPETIYHRAQGPREVERLTS
jgi:phage shock protein A